MEIIADAEVSASKWCAVSWTVVLLHLHVQLTASSLSWFQLHTVSSYTVVLFHSCRPSWQLLHWADSSWVLCCPKLLCCFILAGPIDSFFTELIPVVYNHPKLFHFHAQLTASSLSWFQWCIIILNCLNCMPSWQLLHWADSSCVLCHPELLCCCMPS